MRVDSHHAELLAAIEASEGGLGHGELADRVGKSRNTVVTQMKYLRDHGLVEYRKAGNAFVYEGRA